MFKKSPKSSNDDVIMRIMQDGKMRDVTVKELVLSQSLSLEALTSVLVKKGLVTPQELMDEIELIRKSRSGQHREESDESREA